MNETQKVEEIDLIKLFVKVFKTVRANTALLILFTTVGLILGYLYYSLKDKAFESKMLLSSTVLNESFALKLMDDINQLLADKNTPLLAKVLALPEDRISKVERINVESGTTDKSPNLNDKFYLMISVRVTDQKILPELQKGLIGYLENNKYVKVRIKQKKEFNINMIKKINEEINDLEAFKTKIYKGNFFETTKGNINFDPTTVNSKILDLTKERSSYENNLELAESVQVIDGFTVFIKPLGSRLSTYLMSGWLIGFLLCCLFVVVKYLEKLVRNSK